MKLIILKNSQIKGYKTNAKYQGGGEDTSYNVSS